MQYIRSPVGFSLVDKCHVNVYNLFNFVRWVVRMMRMVRVFWSIFCLLGCVVFPCRQSDVILVNLCSTRHWIEVISICSGLLSWRLCISVVCLFVLILVQ